MPHPVKIKCPVCDGVGGAEDYFGEWSEYPLCLELGEVTPEQAGAWAKERAEIDAECDRLMREDEEASAGAA